MDTPTWDALFEHIGKALDEDVAADPGCQRLGITTGADYLRIWVKLLIERPSQRTSYLFLYSRENNTGKSTFAVSLSYLINPGVAEINQEAFTGTFTIELEGKVLCLIKELDLRDSHNEAYAMLKRILTSPTLTIRRMRTDAYEVPNYTHFIHTANDANFVPCESNDVRLVMIGVSRIEEFIEQDVLNQRLRDEAPSMLRKLFDMPLPERCGRFWLPALQTTLKESVIAGVHDDEVTPAQWWSALLVTAWITGMRRGALLALKWTDVDLNAGTAKSRGKDNKGKRTHLVKLGPAVELLKSLEGSDGRVFPWDHALTWFDAQLLAIQKVAEIKLPCIVEGDHECTPSCFAYSMHDFRRAHATYHYGKVSDRDLQELMGHANFATTRSYAKYAKAHQNAAYAYHLPEGAMAKAMKLVRADKSDRGGQGEASSHKRS